MLFLFVAFVLLHAPQVQAFVDPRSGGWIDSFTGAEQGTALVKHTYNSKSTFKGIFGNKWCSNVETRLTLPTENTIEITFCGDGKRELFRKSEKSTYQSTEHPSRIVIRKNQVYELNSVDDGQIIFNEAGRLLSHKVRSGLLQIEWTEESKIKTIVLNEKRFQFSQKQDLIELKSAQNVYKYALQEMKLVSFSADNKTQNSFKYDKTGLMISITNPFAEKELTYETNSRNVAAISTNKICKERFTYEKKALLYTIKSVFKCLDTPESKKEFTVEYRDNQTRSLKSVSLIEAKQESKTEFDELGRKTKITEDGRPISFAYRPDGTVDRISGANKTELLMRHSTGRDRLESLTFIESNGKPTKYELVYENKSLIGWRKGQDHFRLVLDQNNGLKAVQKNGRVLTVSSMNSSSELQSALSEFSRVTQYQIAYPVRR